jgi:hypothetical protein
VDERAVRDPRHVPGDLRRRRAAAYLVPCERTEGYSATRDLVLECAGGHARHSVAASKIESLTGQGGIGGAGEEDEGAGEEGEGDHWWCWTGSGSSNDGC